MKNHTSDASNVYYEAATADYARQDGASDPSSYAEAAKNAIVVRSRIIPPAIELIERDDD